MTISQNTSMPYMISLASCKTKIVDQGYTVDFKIIDHGLESDQKETKYGPDEIRVINFFRFEGESDPGDKAVLYIIEAADGTRGTLIGSYGSYSNTDVFKFIQDLSIQKKTLKKLR